MLNAYNLGKAWLEYLKMLNLPQLVHPHPTHIFSTFFLMIFFSISLLLSDKKIFCVG
jgi:hypothetical protein